MLVIAKLEDLRLAEMGSLRCSSQNLVGQHQQVVVDVNIVVIIM